MPAKTKSYVNRMTLSNTQTRVFSFEHNELEDLASFVYQSVSAKTALPESDLAQLSRYRTPNTRAQYILSRRLLRDTLVELTGNPYYFRLPIVKSPDGKPEFTDASVAFNLAHTENAIAIIISPQGACGVDVQSTDKALSYDRLAAKLLSPKELKIYECLTWESKKSLFLRLFTLKEAYSKCHGKGLSMSFAAIDFSDFLDDIEQYKFGKIFLNEEYELYFRWRDFNLACVYSKHRPFIYYELPLPQHFFNRHDS